MTPFIETFTGAAFTPLSPLHADIWIEDIAHALSNQCRFSGHSKEFYSVAEHCVRVSWALEAWGEDEDVQLWGLMHDASEAYLVDLPTPLKQSEFGDAYRAAEAKLMRAICERFSLSEKQPEIVHVADAVLLATEARDLMPHKPEHWRNLMVRPLEGEIEPWAARWAEKMFLDRFRELDGLR